MKISDFKLAQVYTRNDLIRAFGGSFMRGMNYCSKTNTLVLISKHTSNRIYGDEFRNNYLIYTGEGQIGDQKYIGANKRLEESFESKLPVHLFIVKEKQKYIYYGLVGKCGDSYFDFEEDVNGEMRKVIKFPLCRISQDEFNYGLSNEYKLEETNIIPTLNVVGAAIMVGDTVLCAQRKDSELKGKWEFPGGKIEDGETPEEALKREIKEELGIDVIVRERIDNSYCECKNRNINLAVYKCDYAGGELTNNVHSKLEWKKSNEIDKLDWADADKPISETVSDMLPSEIVGEPEHFDYFEAKPIQENDKALRRAVQDYEASQKRKAKAGENAEQAVIRYEKDKLNNAGRPDLADMVEQVSKKSSDYGYDVKSFELVNNRYTEVHIEVKSVKKTENYIEFFISENELQKFKTDESYKIYCLYRNGKDYKLHIIKKNEFFSNDYLMPLTYRVRIRIHS